MQLAGELKALHGAWLLCSIAVVDGVFASSIGKLTPMAGFLVLIAPERYKSSVLVGLASRDLVPMMTCFSPGATLSPAAFT